MIFSRIRKQKVFQWKFVRVETYCIFTVPGKHIGNSWNYVFTSFWITKYTWMAFSTWIDSREPFSFLHILGFWKINLSGRHNWRNPIRKVNKIEWDNFINFIRCTITLYKYNMLFIITKKVSLILLPVVTPTPHPNTP